MKVLVKSFHFQQVLKICKYSEKLALSLNAHKKNCKLSQKFFRPPLVQNMNCINTGLFSNLLNIDFFLFNMKVTLLLLITCVLAKSQSKFQSYTH